MALRDKTLEQLARLNSAIGPSFSDARPTGNTVATGTITTVAESLLVDAETFTIDDGINPAIVFEFDIGGGGVAGSNVAVVLAGSETADQVRDAIINAINPVVLLNIVATDGGAATVTLTNSVAGVHGNATLAETVTDAGFVVAGLASGVDFPTVIPTTNADGTDCEDTTRAVVIVKPTDGPVVFDILSRTDNRTDKWEPLNNLTDLAASTAKPFKELIHCAPEIEIAIQIKSGTATLVLTEVQIGPCVG